MKDNLKKKLYHFEADPPKQVWDAIAAALNNTEPLNLKDKLQHFEETPPEEVWDKITGQLNSEPVTIPFYKRYATPLKYMAAAVILFFIACGISLLYNLNTSKNTTFTSTHLHQREKISSPTVSEIRTKKPDNHSISSQKITASKAPDQSKFIKSGPLEANNATKEKLPGRGNKASSLDRVNSSVIINGETSDRYVIFNRNKGKDIKISKKLYDLMDCAYNINAEPCLRKIRKYQAKMAAPTAAPATDFIGIVEVIQDLKENR